MQEYPLDIDDVLVNTGSDVFDIEKLNIQMQRIHQSKELKNIIQKGNLEWDGDESVVWQADPNGVFQILEHPDEDYAGLDVGGVDPYHKEIAGDSDSLGSAFIYRRFLDADHPGDIPIAQYTGRPYTKDEFYDNCLKLAVYYGAKLLVEDNDSSFYACLLYTSPSPRD